MLRWLASTCRSSQYQKVGRRVVEGQGGSVRRRTSGQPSRSTALPPSAEKGVPASDQRWSALLALCSSDLAMGENVMFLLAAPLGDSGRSTSYRESPMKKTVRRNMTCHPWLAGPRDVRRADAPDRLQHRREHSAAGVGVVEPDLGFAPTVTP